MFQTGEGFDLATGRFTSPLSVPAFYLFSANILISHKQSSLFELKVQLGGNHKDYSAISFKRPASKTVSARGQRMYTLSGSGAVKLTGAGPYLSVFIKSSTSTAWSVERNSSVSLVLMSTETSSYFAGFQSTVDNYAYTTGPSCDTVDVTTKWRRCPGLFSKSFPLLGDTFKKATVPETGLYYVESAVNL